MAELWPESLHTEHNVGTIEPRGNDRGDEELRAVGVLSCVGHGEDTGLGVLELEVLVLKLLAVDRLSTGTVAAGEVTTLEHELNCRNAEISGLGIGVERSRRHSR